MSEEYELPKLVKGLLLSQKFAVLATQNNRQPYTNIVAFAESRDLKNLMFATSRATRKYANIANESSVAMLIDNRTNREIDFHKALAITAIGKTVEVDARALEKENFQKIYLSKHPYLQEFVMSPSCALFKVDVEKYYVVRRFQNVMELYV